jgi:hypothetical protein
MRLTPQPVFFFIQALKKNVAMRLTPQPVKVRSDFEVTCFAYEGIDAIKAALMKGIESGYGLYTNTLSLACARARARSLALALTQRAHKRDGVCV